jgi:hypothetical protein
MNTEALQQVTRAVIQILPMGKEGDPREVQATISEPIPAHSMGYIKFQGSLWRAQCLQPVSLELGMLVRVVDRKNLTLILIVEPSSRYVSSFKMTAQTSPYIDG